MNKQYGHKWEKHTHAPIYVDNTTFKTEGQSLRIAISKRGWSLQGAFYPEGQSLRGVFYLAGQSLRGAFYPAGLSLRVNSPKIYSDVKTTFIKMI